MNKIKVVGVVGAGTMGNGIAHVFARSGFQVVLCEVEQRFLDRGLEAIRKNLEREVAKSKLSAAEAEAALQSIRGTLQGSDLGICDFVIEAAPERFELKQELFSTLDAVLKPDSILASNTSSISITRLAAQTQRQRLGLQVNSNRFRPPAMLAKIAASVDVISGGRLEFGIGAGSNLTVPIARREYEAHGLPFHDAAYAVGSLAEACTIIRRLWTETEPFDFDGTYHQLTGAFCSPKPVQQPHPPIMIGGRATPTMRVIAEHADRWNMPGGSIDDAIARSAALDRLCAEIGRDPAEITRSIVLPVSYDRPADTRDAIRAALDGGFSHIVLSMGAPYPAGAARWVADTFIAPAH